MTDALKSARQDFINVLVEIQKVKAGNNKVLVEFIQQLIEKGTKEMIKEDPNKALQAPTVKLSNGLTVANFSDDGIINFMDGNFLPPCDERRVKLFEPKKKVLTKAGKKNSIDIYTAYEASAKLKEEMMALEGRTDIDVILVTVPVMEALKGMAWNFDASKCRTKCFDKITRTVRIDQFGTGHHKVVEPDSVP